MRNKISAIIIDKDYKEHNYTRINLKECPMWDTGPTREQNFDLTILKDDSEIMKELSKNFLTDAIITVGDSEDNYIVLSNLSIDYRKRWTHVDTFEPEQIVSNIISTFLGNINRDKTKFPITFSVFTCVFNTPKDMFMRLYNSLQKQTYVNWNWFILDDSTNPYTSEYISKIWDPRINIIKNPKYHGIIGRNKHFIAMICDGDYLVEVDHDDELTPDCLQTIADAIKKYPESDFLYSHCLEMIGNHPVRYDIPFGYGLGKYQILNVNGTDYNVAVTSSINEVSIRGIHACPNHIRVWKKDFYHKIGGHNVELSCLDDLDLIIRTFLYGQMTQIDKVLYIQWQDDNGPRRNSKNTQGRRYDEIQRTNIYLRHKYNLLIHERVLELGGSEIYWDSDKKYYNIDKFVVNPVELKSLSNLYVP